MNVPLVERIKTAWAIIKNREFYACTIESRYDDGKPLSTRVYSSWLGRKHKLKKLVDDLQFTLFCETAHPKTKGDISDKGISGLASTYIFNHMQGYTSKEKDFAYNYFKIGCEWLLWNMKCEAEDGKTIQEFLKEWYKEEE